MKKTIASLLAFALILIAALAIFNRRTTQRTQNMVPPQAATTSTKTVGQEQLKVAPPQKQAVTIQDPEAQELFALTNADRKANGVPTLEYDLILQASAQAKVDDMVKNSYFSHTNSDGSSIAKWPDQVGYDYSSFGENLAEGYDSIQATEAAFMASPEHKANILDEAHVYSQVGIAIEKGDFEGKEVTFTVVHFGSPAGQ